MNTLTSEQAQRLFAECFTPEVSEAMEQLLKSIRKAIVDVGDQWKLRLKLEKISGVTCVQDNYDNSEDDTIAHPGYVRGCRRKKDEPKNDFETFRVFATLYSDTSSRKGKKIGVMIPYYWNWRYRFAIISHLAVLRIGRSGDDELQDVFIFDTFFYHELLDVLDGVELNENNRLLYITHNEKKGSQ